jgi:hypothetical protein
MLLQFFDDIHQIAADIRRVADCLCARPGSLRATHSGPTKETSMARPKSLAFTLKKGIQGAQGITVPVGDKDTVTVAVLDTAGNPYTGPLTFSVTGNSSSDTTVLTTDPPVGMSYDEHFLKAGTVTVHIVVTFSDASTLTLDDTVTVSGAPGSLTATHSAPVVVS